MSKRFQRVLKTLHHFLLISVDALPVLASAFAAAAVACKQTASPATSRWLRADALSTRPLAGKESKSSIHADDLLTSCRARCKVILDLLDRLPVSLLVLVSCTCCEPCGHEAARAAAHPRPVPVVARKDTTAMCGIAASGLEPAVSGIVLDRATWQLKTSSWRCPKASPTPTEHILSSSQWHCIRRRHNCQRCNRSTYVAAITI